jgi:CHAD domain-containing protein
MSYRLTPGEGVADGIRRIVAEELDDAIAGLRKGAGASPQARDKIIHESRKSLKKSRSALRLAREDLPRGTRRAETTAMRDAARRLSGARDAQVMLDTLAKVVQHAVPPPPPDQVRTVQRALEGRRDALAAQLEGDAGLLGDAAGDLDEVRARVPDWKLRDQGTDSVAAGAAVLYARGRDGMRAALRSGVDDDWHEWRKRVKDLWYSGRILEPLAPLQLGALVEEADRLSDVLGDHNDLAVLLEAIGEDDELSALRAAVVTRRDGLRRAAAPVGRRLYAEKPKAFTRRLRALLAAGEAERTAAAQWMPEASAAKVRELLAAKAAAEPGARRHIAAGLRAHGLRTSDFEAVLPRRAGGFAAEDFEMLVERGIVRVGAPPDPAALGGV